MMNHQKFSDLISNNAQAEFAVGNPLGDDQAIVLAKAAASSRCFCD
jgi:hypothetical protein